MPSQVFQCYASSQTQTVASTGSANAWSNPGNITASDGAACSEYAPSPINLITYGLYVYLDAATVQAVVPDGAIITGMIYRVRARVDNTVPGFSLYPKWGASDGLFPITPTSTSFADYTLGDSVSIPANGGVAPSAATVRDNWTSDALTGLYFRTTKQYTNDTATIYVDQIAIELFWSNPASGNTLFFGENF